MHAGRAAAAAAAAAGATVMPIVLVAAAATRMRVLDATEAYGEGVVVVWPTNASHSVTTHSTARETRAVRSGGETGGEGERNKRGLVLAPPLTGVTKP